MGKNLRLFLLCMILIFACVQPWAKAAEANDSVTIAADSVNIREGPSLNDPQVAQGERGETYPILQETDDWYQIQLADGKTGWVARWLVTKAAPASTDHSSLSPNSLVQPNTDRLRIRSGPGTSFQVVGYLNIDETAKILEVNENWVKISTPSGEGWVNSDYVEVQDQQQSGAAANGVIGTVTANALHIRKSTSIQSPNVGTANKGQSFTILAETNNWSKIEYQPGKYGWIPNWFLDKSIKNSPSATEQAIKESKVTIIQDGSNIRSSANVDADVVERVHSSEQFPILAQENNWYKIRLKSGKSGYVAGWMVSVSGSAPRIKKPGAEAYLKNKTIVLDPGHGGQDRGTAGARGTLEKMLTFRTALLTYDKLKAAGANVILTRTNDSYVSLQSRVSTGIFQHTDVFVSIHYDSSADRSNRGITGYYYHTYQKQLADSLYSETLRQTRLHNRGVRIGDFHVIRENSQKAALLELGYLSNPEEEMILNSGQYQENAATGIYNGLARFFKGH